MKKIYSKNQFHSFIHSSISSIFSFIHFPQNLMGGIKREFFFFFQEITAPISADVSVIWCVTAEENVFVRKREVMRG